MPYIIIIIIIIINRFVYRHKVVTSEALETSDGNVRWPGKLNRTVTHTKSSQNCIHWQTLGVKEYG